MGQHGTESTTNTRKKDDFACFVLDLVEKHFPDVEYIQLVMDNLNTHFEGSLLETFGTRKTKSLMKKLRFIYTPKHASWLNMAEIEINIMDIILNSRKFQHFFRLQNFLRWRRLS